MTPDQKRDLNRLRAYIQRHGLTSHMSDARWARVEDALNTDQNGPIEFRVRCVRDSTDPSCNWERGFREHLPTPRVNIEWLDIRRMRHTHRGALVPDLLDDCTARLVQTLQSCAAPFSIESDALRIWGYTRAGSSPRWIRKGEDVSC